MNVMSLRPRLFIILDLLVNFMGNEVLTIYTTFEKTCERSLLREVNRYQ